jgi:hypothetical protein
MAALTGDTMPKDPPKFDHFEAFYPETIARHLEKMFAEEFRKDWSIKSFGMVGDRFVIHFARKLGSLYPDSPGPESTVG